MEEENDNAKRGVKFYINGCPHETFARFNNFCKELSCKSGLTFASYPLGLKKLLDHFDIEKEKEKEETVKTFGR